MDITAPDLHTMFFKIFKQEIGLDTPLVESGARLDSLRIIRMLVEIENMLPVPLPQEDAFELFGLSINQLVVRLNAMAATASD